MGGDHLAQSCEAYSVLVGAVAFAGLCRLGPSVNKNTRVDLLRVQSLGFRILGSKDEVRGI